IIIYAGRYVTEGAVNAGGVSLTSSGLNGSQAGTIALDAAGAVTSGALSATASGPLSLGGNIFIVAGRNASLGVVNASGLELSAGGDISITSRFGSVTLAGLENNSAGLNFGGGRTSIAAATGITANAVLDSYGVDGAQAGEILLSNVK